MNFVCDSIHECPGWVYNSHALLEARIVVMPQYCPWCGKRLDWTWDRLIKLREAPVDDIQTGAEKHFLVALAEKLLKGG